MKTQHLGYGSSGRPFEHAGEKHCRWIEKPASAYGLRVVGFADEVAKRNYSYAYGIDHTGWYTNDFQDEKLRGVVLQMAARNGRPQYIPGYADPNNPGCYLASFDEIFEGEKGGAAEGASYDKAARDCAHRADQFAEWAAEQEREYQEAWQAGQHYRDLGDEISAARKVCLALIREAKAACKSIAGYSAVKEAIRDKIESHVDAIRAARKRREELFAQFGRESAFNDS